MILSSFYYTDKVWTLDKLSEMHLETLIVGRNAAGKSRSIQALQIVADFLIGRNNPLIPKSFAATLKFSNVDESGKSLIYSLDISKEKVSSERFVFGDDVVIERNVDVCIIKTVNVNPPKDRLVIQVRRDQVLYPEIELLIKWAETLSCVFFADFTSKYIYNNSPENAFRMRLLSKMVDTFDTNSKKRVVEEMRELGFPINKISLLPINDNMNLTLIHEDNLTNPIADFLLSNGMARTLYLLVFMEYVRNINTPSMLLIDDLGEGLDYHRSTELGRMLFEFCHQHNVQLIVSSNDAFLMDIIDIDNWQVLRRKGNKVSCINLANSADLFRNFRMTGLSNFDLFSSDFIDNYLNSKAE